MLSDKDILDQIKSVHERVGPSSPSSTDQDYLSALMEQQTTLAIILLDIRRLLAKQAGEEV